MCCGRTSPQSEHVTVAVAAVLAPAELPALAAVDIVAVLGAGSLGAVLGAVCCACWLSGGEVAAAVKPRRPRFRGNRLNHSRLPLRSEQILQP